MRFPIDVSTYELRSVYIYKLKSHIKFFLFLSCKIIAKKTSSINIVKCKHVFIFSHYYAFSVLLILSFKISYELKNKFISLERREYENLVNFMITTVNNTQDLTHFARLIQRDFFISDFFLLPFIPTFKLTSNMTLNLNIFFIVLFDICKEWQSQLRPNWQL